MGSSCFKAASSNEPEEDDNTALPWTLTPWLGPNPRAYRNRNRRLTGESSNVSNQVVGSSSSTAGPSSSSQSIPETETGPRISEQQLSLYRSFPEENPRIRGVAFKVDTPELMHMYLRKLVQPEIPNDKPRSLRNTPMVIPGHFVRRVRFITDGQLPDTFTLKKRVDEKVLTEGIGIHVNIMAVNMINAGLDIFMRRLLESRYANSAPGRMILPLKRHVVPRTVVIWFSPSLITPMERKPHYDRMFSFAPEQRRKVPEPRVYVVDINKNWQKCTKDFFRKLRCQVLTANSLEEAFWVLGLTDDTPRSAPRSDEIRKLDMICVEYHLARRNGLELLRKMKSTERWKNTPFIMTSSSTNDRPGLINQCLEEGTDMFVMKLPVLGNPSDREELEYWLRRILYK